MTLTRPKVYIYAYGRWEGSDDLCCVAVTEDGVGLAEHVSSSMWWARQDLHESADRRALYEAAFGGWGDGEFYDLVVVPVGEAPPPDVLEAIAWRNAAIADMSQAVPRAEGPDPDGKIFYTFTVYRDPVGLPPGFAVRQFQVGPGAAETGPLLVSGLATLDEARGQVPRFADTRLPRSEHDHPTVVETWC